MVYFMNIFIKNLIKKMLVNGFGQKVQIESFLNEYECSYFFSLWA